MKYLFSIIFIIVLYLPLLNSVTHVFKFERKSENRTFHDSLTIDINHLDNFPEECKNYLNDNFEFRTPLLDLHSTIKRSLFHTSPYPDKLIIGTDDWYFLAGDELQIYKGKRNFSQEELVSYENEWNRRCNYLDSLNIKYCWVICPSKLNVYEDNIPFFYRKADVSRVSVLTARLSKRYPNLIYNPISDLKKEVLKGNDVYFRNDNHWNARAGSVITKGIVKRMQGFFPNESMSLNYSWKDTIKEGGYLNDLLGVETLVEKIQIPIFEKSRSKSAPKFGFEPPLGFIYPYEYEIHFIQSEKKNNLKILVIRDSFGVAVMPFIQESFGESLFIFDDWQYNLNEKIIEVYKPDIVVFMGLETHIRNIIK